MSNGALAVADPQQASPLAVRLNVSNEKLELVRSQIAPEAPDDVLEMYFELCRVNGFDPFAKMLYAISRNAKVNNQWVKRWTFQTSIDGFRSIAEDTGEDDGQDEPQFTYDAQGKLFSATVAVYRKSKSRPIKATALWAEYVQTDNDGAPSGLWKKMPHGQLSKCAEALALRKAYPKRLAKIYTSDEMGQSSNVAPPSIEHLPGDGAAHAALPTGERNVTPAGDSVVDEATLSKRRAVGAIYKALALDPKSPSSHPAAMKAVANASGISDSRTRWDQFETEQLTKFLEYRKKLEEPPASAPETVQPTAEPCPACHAAPGSKHAEDCPEEPLADEIPEAQIRHRLSMPDGLALLERAASLSVGADGYTAMIRQITGRPDAEANALFADEAPAITAALDAIDPEAAARA